jgi:HAD superfamily phosphatase (TIGR01668 family)
MAVRMSFSLLPKMVASALTDIHPELLRQRGIQLLMLDFDNTIVPYTTNAPTEKMQTWLEEMMQTEITVCVVSNSRNDRVKDFCKVYGIPCITHARKPFSDGIHSCLTLFQTPPERAALVGDQIYTDVLGANCAGVTSVLIDAIDNHNIWLKLRHVAEMPFRFAARNRRIEL